MSKRSGDPRDAEIGKRVRALRLHRGLSQTELGNELEITFQQVQKYEKGTNRISAGRLQKIGEVLNVPITFFFKGDEEEGTKSGSTPADVNFDFLQTDNAMRLVRAYSRIKQRGIQLKLLRLTESIAGK
jgi:transcriptional regulator with XRE-family HTH domain